MNKSDLVSRVAVDADLSKRDATQAIDATLAAIQGALAKGDKVTLPGFGTFEPRKRAARTARNPRTGAAIKVKATTVPAFKAGQGLKDAVGGNRKSATATKKASAKSKAKPSTARKR